MEFFQHLQCKRVELKKKTDQVLKSLKCNEMKWNWNLKCIHWKSASFYFFAHFDEFNLQKCSIFTMFKMLSTLRKKMCNDVLQYLFPLFGRVKKWARNDLTMNHDGQTYRKAKKQWTKCLVFIPYFYPLSAVESEL